MFLRCVSGVCLMHSAPADLKQGSTCLGYPQPQEVVDEEIHIWHGFEARLRAMGQQVTPAEKLQGEHMCFRCKLSPKLQHLQRLPREDKHAC